MIRADATATLTTSAASAIPITALDSDGFGTWSRKQPAATRAWIEGNGFKAEAGAVCLLPNAKSRVERVLFGLDRDDPWCWAQLAAKLPAGSYRIDGTLVQSQANWAALAWALAAYRFGRYKLADKKARATLVWPTGADRKQVESAAQAIAWVRDLVNTPAADMGPAELAGAATKLAKQHKAKLKLIVGDALLKANYPAVHAVGRASSRAPRLIDFTWGNPRAPKVTLVGKGVCFDSGGLDIKPSSGMLNMKKDMGGAAHALGLASMIMDAGLKVRLRVLIPAVENAISGNAMRPLDVLPTRKGKTVEIGNTDAEGRLILCDCLAEADAEKPALLIDFATLTGAARVALGPDLPALFANDDRLAADILDAGEETSDPLWRLPLWKPYRKWLDSKVAEISSTGSSPFAGSITAALFLADFVSADTAWAHFDLFAWNATTRPGRPEGGEAMGLRALFYLLEKRYG
ncbi:MAG TPA: leucyl aminopeptidase family protein [Magnetospirillaceae bacterium]|jgi:leucyl aminopeptidase